MQVTGGAFDMLGVTPILGRGITAADAQDGAPPVVVLRHDLWASRFGADPAIVGRTLRVDGQPATVVGVMPRGFSFPEDQSLWVPLVPTDAARARKTPYARYAVGRLAAGARLEDARTELATIGARLSATYADTNDHVVPAAHTFTDWFIGPQSTLLYRATLGAVQFVTLIATVNVAALLLERVRGAGHDLTVRMALGASRWRVITHVLDRFARVHAFERNIAAFFLVFSAVALLLAVVGVYAVAARAVHRRRREIGIRSAVGATRTDVFGLIAGRGMMPVAAGLAGGLGLSWLAMPALRTVLVGVAPLDAVSLALASTILFTAGAVGCLLPAWHAAHMDPAQMLREKT